MDRPSLSPDLNPKENMWSDMSKIIYGEGKQCRNTCELKTAILLACLKISLEKKNYVAGMQNRMLVVSKERGLKLINECHATNMTNNCF